MRRRIRSRLRRSSRGTGKPTSPWTVDANPVGSPTDLVLVLDVSYSMTDSKLSALKSAAKTLVQRVLDGDPDSRVAIVRYSTEADAYNFGSSVGWREYSDINTNSGRTYFTSSRSAADGVIDGLSRDLYTNTEGGFMAADRVMELDGRSDAEFAGNGSRVIVFMTDGVPTAHYNDNLSTSTSGGQSSATDINEAMAAGAAAMTQTKGGVDGDTTIFTVGLVSGMSDMEVSVARLLLHNQAHVDSHQLERKRLDEHVSGSGLGLRDPVLRGQQTPVRWTRSMPPSAA